ncbi:MAG: Hsp20/alpha crystallin family protein [Verrucomicrobiales bacterium]
MKLIKSTNRLDPFLEIENVQKRLSDFVSHLPVRWPWPGDHEEAVTLADWAPAVDITEDEKEYLISTELPAMKKEEVKAFIENGTLLISGERKVEKEEKNKKFHRVERSYGRFERSFALPTDADPEKVTANYKDGMLMVHIAKSIAAKPKQLEVKIT